MRQHCVTTLPSRSQSPPLAMLPFAGRSTPFFLMPLSLLVVLSLSLSLSLCVAAPAPAMWSPPANVTVGLIAPLTGPYAVQYAAVVYLAHRGIDAINANTALLPHTHLQLAVRDSKSDKAATIAATVSLVLPVDQGGAGAVAIIGELFSGISEVEVRPEKHTCAESEHALPLTCFLGMRLYDGRRSRPSHTSCP